MDGGTLTYVLALFTLAAVVAFGAWQYVRAKRAKRNHEHSALTTPGAAPPGGPRRE